ncbi:MAG: hypothetical protein RR540_01335, partial [Oscillospiraceae bacterium]
MAIIVSQVDAPLKTTREEIIAAACWKIGVLQKDVLSSEIHKTSVDARKQNAIKFVSSVYLKLKSEEQEQKICEKRSDCSPVKEEKLAPKFGTKKLSKPIVIAGFGPAGMFAALTLAEYGYKPIVFERGENVDERVKKVSNFWENGVLDPSTNVQFGEGGAGTFSDGKLTTRIKDPLCGHVLEKLVEFGAPAEILTKSKPHIGTDNLRLIVKSIRQKVTELGGEIHFNSPITGLKLENGRLSEINVSGNSIEAENLILSIGHSARDTFEMLLKSGVKLEAKPFSVGARIEHTQEAVDRSLYGKYFDNPLLPRGEYQLSHRFGERCAYTFCMCPGGVVVPSASEEFGVVTNGMSEFSRDGKNANSALAVSVSPSDFGDEPLAGVEFCRKIEQKAYVAAGKNYKAPAASVGSFMDGGASLENIGVTPSYSLGVTAVNFDDIFPDFVTKAMRMGLRYFSGNMSCFGDKSAVLTAP